MEKIKAAVSMELWPEHLKELESCCDVKTLRLYGHGYPSHRGRDHRRMFWL